MRYEHSAQNPLCSHYDALALQSSTNASSVINQHSDDNLDDGPCHENEEHPNYVLDDHPYHENETSGTTAVYGEGGISANKSVQKCLQ